MCSPLLDYCALPHLDCACVGSCIVDHDALVEGRLHLEVRNGAPVNRRPLEEARGAYINELDSTRAGFNWKLMCSDLRSIENVVLKRWGRQRLT